jgi:hypothetical protein
LRAALVEEARQDPAQRAKANPPTNPDIADSAALHGHDLFTLGLSIDQVVRGYGDVCQAVTELAVEQDASISVAEFHTLNRCLDNAIASAVSVWSKRQETALSAPGRQRSGLPRTLRGLLSGAIVAFDQLRAGHVAAGGSTGDVLGRNLREMQTILDTSSPEVRSDAGAPPSSGTNGNGAPGLDAGTVAPGAVARR